MLARLLAVASQSYTIGMDNEQLLGSAVGHYPTREISRLETAVTFAGIAHAGQTRLSGEPYISHCLAVAAALIDWRLDMNSVIAGVLHDCIEDTELTYEEIEQKFGHEVAFLVEGVTKVGEARRGMQDMSSYRPSTKSNLSKLLIAVSHDLRVLLIKLADRLHNLQTLEYLPEEKRTKIARESLEVFAPLADRLGIGNLRVQLEELSFKYLEPMEYDRLQKIIKKRIGSSQKRFLAVRHGVAAELGKAGLEFSIDGRVKSTYSLHKKLRKVDDIEQVYDLLALRLIVGSAEQCYQVLGILHAAYQPMINKIKDYIAVPKANGYQSLHTTVITPNELIVEFQIRSQAMHELAERGLAASFHYNEQKFSDSYAKRSAVTLPRRLEWINHLQVLADRLSSGGSVADGELGVDLFADRIFVHSPQGDIFDLPEGAFPLDFAFAVHSDIALHANGVKVNGKIAPFSRCLQNGDIVEVQTGRNVLPKADWLDYAVTSKARQKIKAALKKE